MHNSGLQLEETSEAINCVQLELPCFANSGVDETVWSSSSDVIDLD